MTNVDPFAPDDAPVLYRSVSQVTQYLPGLGGCPHQYWLQRRERAWQRPAAWLPHGTALHAAAEAWERSGRTMSRDEAKEVFAQTYVDGIHELTAETPNFRYWSSSGPYRGKADVERRFGIGLGMVDRYIDYYEKTPDEVIWVADDGTPGIELGFDVSFAGVQMKGFVDQVVRMTKQAGVLRVRDIKSGANPGATVQLKIYQIAMKLMYGIEVPEGDYWMGKLGKPAKKVYDLTKISDQEVFDLVHQADAGIRAEDWDPAPEAAKCRRCPVSTACEFFVD